jgi:hypothetical protein
VAWPEKAHIIVTQTENVTEVEEAVSQYSLDFPCEFHVLSPFKQQTATDSGQRYQGHGIAVVPIAAQRALCKRNPLDACLSAHGDYF